MRIQPNAMSYIYRVSSGTPRLINKYCEAIIINAELQGIHLIDAKFAKHTLKSAFGIHDSIKGIFELLIKGRA